MAVATIVCKDCQQPATRTHRGMTPTRCLGCQERHRELLARHRSLACKAARRRLLVCYVCHEPALRPGTRCHKCSRAALGRKKATFYPCRECNGPCTKPGGRCRRCSEDETIGTYQRPPHPDPAMHAHLEALHQRALQRLPLVPLPPRDCTLAAKAS